MWVAVDLDDTLLHPDSSPEDGASEAMGKLLEEGHRVTIWSARLSKVPEDKREEMAKKIELELTAVGIPFSDVCTGPKPPADLFIGDNVVPFTGSWPKTLAQAHMMMDTRGSSDVHPPHEYEEAE
jgi:hypothetical protein